MTTSVRTKLLAALSAVVMLVIGAVVSPLGERFVNLIWPDAEPALTLPAASMLPNGEGCRDGGPPLSITMSYNFRGAAWWATAEKLPPTVVGELNANNGSVDPEAVLARYSPVQSLVGGGTGLRLVATGCGAKNVVVTNISANVSKRDKPLSAGIVSQRPQGSVPVTKIGFDLDQPKPAALTMVPETNKLGEPYFAANAMQVAPGESVPFEIMAWTQKSYLEWSLHFETLVDGNAWNFDVAMPQDKPIRSNAPAPSYETAFWMSEAITGFEPTTSADVIKLIRPR